MPGRRTHEELEEWRPGRVRSSAVLVCLLTLVLVGCNLGGTSTASPLPPASGSAGVSQTPSTASASPSAAPASATASPTRAASPTPRPTPAVTALCRPGELATRVTLWEGAAGHRIGHVRLTNKGKAPCLVHAKSQPQLVDGMGSVVINGAAAGSSPSIVLAPGGVLTTLVQDGDYCKATPIPPVTVAFVLGGGAGRIVAAPVSSSDVGGVPPCLGTPGTPGDIEMQPWTP